MGTLHENSRPSPGGHLDVPQCPAPPQAAKLRALLISPRPTCRMTSGNGPSSGDDRLSITLVMAAGTARSSKPLQRSTIDSRAYAANPRPAPTAVARRAPLHGGPMHGRASSLCRRASHPSWHRTPRGLLETEQYRKEIPREQGLRRSAGRQPQVLQEAGAWLSLREIDL